MNFKVTTTITTLIDVDTFKTTHSADIVEEDGLPEDIVRAAAKAACQATLNGLKAEEEEN